MASRGENHLLSKYRVCDLPTSGVVLLAVWSAVAEKCPRDEDVGIAS